MKGTIIAVTVATIVLAGPASTQVEADPDVRPDEQAISAALRAPVAGASELGPLPATRWLAGSTNTSKAPAPPRASAAPFTLAAIRRHQAQSSPGRSPDTSAGRKMLNLRVL